MLAGDPMAGKHNRGAGPARQARTPARSPRVTAEQTQRCRRVRAGRVTPIKDPIEIDFSVIEDLAEGDPAAMADLVATFVRHTTEGIARVRAAIEAGDLAEAARAAHTCVGFTATIGITALVPTIRELERTAKEGRREDLARLIEQWEREFEIARRALESRLGQR
jgi:HPt (histidine-containing phosphotransfer) domain-containing protein